MCSVLRNPRCFNSRGRASQDASRVPKQDVEKPGKLQYPLSLQLHSFWERALVVAKVVEDARRQGKGKARSSERLWSSKAKDMGV